MTKDIISKYIIDDGAYFIPHFISKKEVNKIYSMIIKVNNKKGKGEGNRLNPLIEELKEQQKNIINKNIDKQTINRQQEILTRLLESEKALLEKGFEEKRESKTGKNTQKGNKILFEEYNKEKLKQIELLRYTEPFFKKYYKEKADEYFDKN